MGDPEPPAGPGRCAGAVRALCFDVFGTVVDWRGSIVHLGQELGLAVDWPALADAWRAEYRPGMDLVRTGELPWTDLDGLHRRSLARLAPEFGIDPLDAETMDRLCHFWHRLDPWPDSAPGIERLRRERMVATLSNGTVAMLISMARRAGIGWDMVLSAELFGRYKPDRQVYEGAARLLGLAPGQVMMVAAHRHDLEAAREAGMRTAFVHRPAEHGPGADARVPEDAGFDVYASNMCELAERLGPRDGRTDG